VNQATTGLVKDLIGTVLEMSRKVTAQEEVKAGHLIIGSLLVLAMLIVPSAAAITQAPTLSGSSPNTSALGGNLSSDIAANALYTAPIGAFTVSDVYANPNGTYDIDYLFYSRDYGPGTVTCTVSAWDNFGYIPADELTASLEPAAFTAEPNHVYRCRLHVVTGPAFAAPEKLNSSQYLNGHMTYSVEIGLNVTLQNNTFNYAGDSMRIREPLIIPGLSAVESDRLIIPANDTAFTLQASESNTVPFEFYRGQGISNISYNLSTTPLNVTVVPQDFVAKQDQKYPAHLIVHADRSLAPGNYSFTLEAIGADGIRSPYLQEFFVNVTAPEKVPTQSPLPVMFVIFAIGAAGIFRMSLVRREK
jgi:hypothetical protein